MFRLSLFRPLRLSSRALTTAPPVPPVIETEWQQEARQLNQHKTSWVVRSLARGMEIPAKYLANHQKARSLEPALFEVWVEVLRRKDLVWAMQRLGLLESAGVDREVLECPDWLFLDLPKMLDNLRQSPYLTSLILSPRFRLLNPQDQALFLARAIKSFLKVQDLVAARESVEWICWHETQIRSPRSFDRFFEALVSYRRTATHHSSPTSVLLRPLVQMLRTAMVEREIQPTDAIFQSLFSPVLIPHESRDAYQLLVAVAKAQLPLDKTKLHAVMRVFARKGQRVEAATLLESIIQLQENERGTPAQEGEEMEESAVETEDEGLLSPSTVAQAEVVEEVESSKRETEEEAVDSAMRLLDTSAVVNSSVYTTTFLRALRSDPPAAFAYFESLQRGTDRIYSSAWSSLLDLAAHSPAVSIAQLFILFQGIPEEVAAVRMSPRVKRNVARLYTILLRGLLKRSAPEEVVRVWGECVQRDDIALDAHLLGAFVEGLIALGRVHEAEQWVGFYGTVARHVQPSSTPFFSTSQPLLAVPPRVDAQHSIPLDIVVVNLVLSAYNRAGNASLVYNLFTTLPERHDVSPDAASLSILLDTARFLSAAAGRGYGPGDEGLSFETGRQVDDTWNGKQAWREAEGIMWNMLESAWPDVAANLVDPGRELELGREIKRWWRGSSDLGGSEKEGEGRRARTTEGTLGRPFPATFSIEPPLYPTLYPTPRLFRSFIQLLGYHSTASAITPVLAWMRALDSVPERSTVLLALLYIGEGAFQETRRAKIRAWLVDWLGEAQVPDELEIAAARRGRATR